VKAEAKRPHYRVISVSVYEVDLARLDAEVQRRKAGQDGRVDQATRSGLLRELIRTHLPEASEP
jgi:hypothetical protein